MYMKLSQRTSLWCRAALGSPIVRWRSASLLAPLLAGLLLASCSDQSIAVEDPPVGEEHPAGGSTTLYNATSNAFSLPAPNLSGAGLQLHFRGDASFEATFVTAPATVNGGLGPIYNNTSCISCHARDGRGRPPLPGETTASMLFRISVPGQAEDGGPAPVPGFGGQLQERSIFGRQTEATMTISYRDSIGRFADGSEYRLQIPRYAPGSSYRPLPSDLQISPRVAPPVFGLGLLEAVSEATILAGVDEGDADGDGISGRPNYVWDIEKGRRAIGRFGWKANSPTLLQQVAAAYSGDMGVTSSLFPVESCHGQPQADQDDSDDPEISDDLLRATAYYTQTLGVPARRNTGEATVRRGERLFREANCSGCHRPTMVTGVLDGIPEVSGQKIAPYTDMLLHDMGEGLSDGRPDYLAGENEWRTPPLWGIGLTQVINGHTNFLHDGRARSLIEAIMWHGGEAERSREFVRKLPAADRAALLAFLQSL